VIYLRNSNKTVVILPEESTLSNDFYWKYESVIYKKSDWHRIYPIKIIDIRDDNKIELEDSSETDTDFIDRTYNTLYSKEFWYKEGHFQEFIEMKSKMSPKELYSKVFDKISSITEKENFSVDYDFSSITEDLKKLFPHGHPDFIKFQIDKMKLHSDKNHDYASGGDPMGNFNREAVIFSLYPKFKMDSPVGVALSLMVKQFDAAMWMYSNELDSKTGEGLPKRLDDMSVYCDLAKINHIEEVRRKNENSN